MRKINLMLLIDKTTLAAERWAAAREKSAASAARNGLANLRLLNAESAAQTRYEQACDALRAAARNLQQN